jgi:catechol 2,3-dioxygenase-like lactoylglutathione lyase family enzyme
MPNASSEFEGGVSLAEALAWNPQASIAGVHHFGITVSNLEKALAFWEKFLGKPARWAMILDRPYLGRIVGYPGVSIKGAFFDLPGGVVVELLDYHQASDRLPNPEATANPGNMHLCLCVDDAQAAWSHAVSCGARPVSSEGPIEIDGGPNEGARVAYLRIHDGVTLEVFEPVGRTEAPPQ